MNNAKPLDLAAFEGHTPGPWNRSGGIMEGAGLMLADARMQSKETATPWGLNYYRPYLQYEADAKLIAAAPALLAECRRQRFS